ncbi:hypothetical protein ACFE04_027446 [Oxalis oulophora]
MASARTASFRTAALTSFASAIFGVAFVGLLLQSVDTYQVKIVNKLSNEQELNIHCYFSNIDDRGFHTLTRFGQVYDFKFDISFSVQRDYFTCDLKHDDEYVSFHSFILDLDFLDYQCGGRDCIWIAAPDGIYLTDTYSNKDWLMYKWQKVGFESSNTGPLRTLTNFQIIKIAISHARKGIKKIFMTYLYQPFRDLKGVIRRSKVLIVTMIVAIKIMIVLLGLFMRRILHRYLANYDKNPFEFKYNLATTDLEVGLCDS